MKDKQKRKTHAPQDWHPNQQTQREIAALLNKISAAEQARNLSLPALSPEATKLLAQQIKTLLRKDLH